MRTALTILTVILLLPSGLFFVLTAACTSLYTGRRPSGPDAMGLAIPFFICIAAGLATLIATWCTFAAGGFEWLAPSSRPLGFVLSTALAIGVGLGSFFAFLLWAEGRSGIKFIDSIFVPVSVAIGLVGPVVFVGIVLVSALTASDPDNLPTLDPAAARALRVFAYGLAPLVLIGYLLGGAGLVQMMTRKLAREAAIAERFEADRKEEARREALSPVERLREDFATHSPESPLWLYVASLPDETNEECRELYIARARQVPSFEQALVGTLTNGWPRFAHGCLVLVLHMPSDAALPTQLWSDALANAARTSAAQIRDEESWLTPDYHRNPDPVGFIRAMIAAASRLGASENLAAPFNELRDAIASRPESPERAEALAALAPIAQNPAASTPGPR